MCAAFIYLYTWSLNKRLKNGGVDVLTDIGRTGKLSTTQIPYGEVYLYFLTLAKWCNVAQGVPVRGRKLIVLFFCFYLCWRYSKIGIRKYPQRRNVLQNNSSKKVQWRLIFDHPFYNEKHIYICQHLPTFTPFCNTNTNYEAETTCLRVYPHRNKVQTFRKFWRWHKWTHILQFDLDVGLTKFSIFIVCFYEEKLVKCGETFFF